MRLTSGGRLAAVFLVCLLLALAAGWVWWLTRPPRPGPLRLAPASFADLPGWNGSDARPALTAFARSCVAILARAPDAPMGGAGYAGTESDWRPACRAAFAADDARGFFEHWFRPVKVSAGRVSDGLFTGYYEPELAGSRRRHGPYRTPVYGLPGDLVSVDLGRFRPKLKGVRIAGRVEGHRLVPYATRAEIDAHGAAAPVLFYAADPVSVFFLQVQGSGRVRLDNGTTVRAVYAGQNGQPYTAIGRTLVAMGALAKKEVSLETIRAWLVAHPDKARAVMESDASYVFFREAPVTDPKLGAPGTEGVPLTPEASIAVDPRLHPLGAPFFIAATLPGGGWLRHLYIAQDTGGAIRGPVRADIFWGFGPKAESMAGRMNETGRLFVLLPKPLAARLGDGKDFPDAVP